MGRGSALLKALTSPRRPLEQAAAGHTEGRSTAKVSLGTGFGDSFAPGGRVLVLELVAGELHHETQLVLAE